MLFERCFVPESARLPGVNSFKDTNKVLAISRYLKTKDGLDGFMLACMACMGRGEDGTEPLCNDCFVCALMPHAAGTGVGVYT